jgi:uncharacterized protein (TIGR00369 family)
VIDSFFDNWVAGGDPERIAKAIGLSMTASSRDHVVIEFTVGEHHYNPVGTLHGGVLCYLADTAMGFAWASGVAQDETFATVEMKINFFRPVWSGKLIADSTVIRRGKTVGYAECEVKDEQGRLVAKSSSTLMTLRGQKAADRGVAVIKPETEPQP